MKDTYAWSLQMFKIGVCYDEYPKEPKFFGYFNDIEGLDGDQVINLEEEIYQIKLLNGSLNSEFQKQLEGGLSEFPENIYLAVFDHHDEPAAWFFLALVKIIETAFNQDKTVNLTLVAFMHTARPGRYQSWKMKMSGEITHKNKWLALHPSERQGWLGMAIQCNQNLEGPGKHVVVDGTLIDDRNGFYCALGEAINGPGGYFGRNLDALDDCLNGGFGPIPISVTWKNSNVSKAKMPDFETFVNVLEKIFSEDDIPFILA